MYVIYKQRGWVDCNGKLSDQPKNVGYKKTIKEAKALCDEKNRKVRDWYWYYKKLKEL